MKSIPPLLPLLLLACSAPKQETPVENTSAGTEASSENNTSEEPPIANPANVLDYFALLQWKNLADDYYMFVEHNGQFVCVENLGDEYDYSGPLDEVRLYPSTVDIKNGYRNIEDEGTGDGLLNTEVALFRKSDNTYLVAISAYGSTPPHMDQYLGSKPHFYLWQNNDFVDVSKEVLPSIPLPEGYNEYYRLPQIGRVIKYTQYTTNSTSNEESTSIQFEFDSSSGTSVRKN